jgi:hypothetical protein
MHRYRDRRATEHGRHGAPPGMPRWVKAFLIIALILVVVLVIGLITGRAGPGGHGPSRHLGSGDPSELASTVIPDPRAGAADPGARRR